MFIRPCYKKSNGNKLAYWALVESYRTAKGLRQRVVAYLGQLKDGTRRGIKRIADVPCALETDVTRLHAAWFAVRSIFRSDNFSTT